MQSRSAALCHFCGFQCILNRIFSEISFFSSNIDSSCSGSAFYQEFRKFCVKATVCLQRFVDGSRTECSSNYSKNKLKKLCFSFAKLGCDYRDCFHFRSEMKQKIFTFVINREVDFLRVFRRFLA